MPCREQPGRPLTFKWVVRCHSQPVNDYWRLRGTPAQVRVRSFLQSPQATWEALETGRLPDGSRTPMQPKPGLKAHVYAWARGELANPVPRLADFSAPGVSDVPPGAPVIGGNAFFVEGESARWPEEYVTIQPARGLQTLSPTTIAVGVGALAALIAAGYFAWRVMNPMRRRACNAPRKIRYDVLVDDNGITVFARGRPSSPLFRPLGSDVVGRLVAQLDRDAAQVVSIGVDPKLQRKGVATRMYELASQRAAEEFGLPLRSDIARTQGPEFFWQKQVAKGRARPVHDESGFLRFYELAYPPPPSLKNNSRLAAQYA